jgi:hypothetical protein
MEYTRCQAYYLQRILHSGSTRVKYGLKYSLVHVEWFEFPNGDDPRLDDSKGKSRETSISGGITSRDC